MNTVGRVQGRWRRHGVWVVTVAVVVVAAFLVWALLGAAGRNATTTPMHTPTPASSTAVPVSTAAPYQPLSQTAIKALPEAKYDAVIPGLLPYDRVAPATASTTYTLASDTPIYGAGHRAPVARFAGKNFLNNPTVITPVQVVGGWALVLTPARKTLPSQSDEHAAPQTAGWVRSSALHTPTSLPDKVLVSVSAQTLTIEGAGEKTSFKVGVGAAGTPTPTGVSGYLQARYLDPAQNQTVYPIQLTSLHSAAADEPYSGHDGGLIGVHYYPDTTGDISHGCIRLTSTAITAVNKLPLGTLITITP